MSIVRSPALRYAIPSLSTGLIFPFMALYYLKYATDTLGISAGAMGWIFLASRLWDAVSDPIAGVLSDRTRSRWGRRRPWIVCSALPLGVVFYCLVAPPSEMLGTDALVIWVAVNFILFYSVMTVFAVPYDALGAELSSDYHERTRIFGLRRVFYGVGALLGLMVVANFSSQGVGDPEIAEAGRAAGGALGFAVLLTCLVFIPLPMLGLHEPTAHLGKGTTPPIQIIKDLIRNVHARRLLIVFFIQQLGIVSLTLSATYFTHYILDDESLIGPSLILFFISATASVPVWIWLSRRFEKKTLLIVAMATISIAILPALFVGPDQIPLFLAVLGVAGFASGATDVLFPSIQADVIDWDEYETGDRKEGSYFAAWHFSSKTAAGVAGMLVGFALDAAGYVPGIEQGPAALWTIRGLYGGLPFVLWTTALILFLPFNLNAAEHARLKTRLAERGARQ
jgi:sugar (glycoside-pentoside-hexuronide) transporter